MIFVSFCIGMQDLRTNKTWCERAVILMRDPYEAILSEYNRQYSYSHTGTAQIFGIRKYRPTSATYSTKIPTRLIPRMA